MRCLRADWLRRLRNDGLRADRWGAIHDRLVRETDGMYPAPQRGILHGAEIHPVKQHHGSLYADSDVKMRLKLELTRPFGPQ